MAYGGDGTMKKDEFYNTLGADYLPFAFETAKAANPRPLLSLNGESSDPIWHDWHDEATIHWADIACSSRQ